MRPKKVSELILPASLFSLFSFIFSVFFILSLLFSCLASSLFLSSLFSSLEFLLSSLLFSCLVLSCLVLSCPSSFIFSCLLVLSRLLLSSLLSSLCLRVVLCVVLCGVCVVVVVVLLVVVVCVWCVLRHAEKTWKNPCVHSKTPPCVHSKRLRVYFQNVPMCTGTTHGEGSSPVQLTKKSPTWSSLTWSQRFTKETLDLSHFQV